MDSHPSPIRVGRAEDGTLIYLIEQSPEALPPVLGRDLAAAWEASRSAALGAAWGTGRVFRFRRADGGTTDLALHDPDACCWAGAVDRTVGIGTSYGLSLCLRLLALIDLLARAPWTSGLLVLDRAGAELHPALLRAAAGERLTAEARFDETRLRAGLAGLPAPRRGERPAAERAPATPRLRRPFPPGESPRDPPPTPHRGIAESDGRTPPGGTA